MTDHAPITPSHWGLLDAEAQHLAFPDAFPIPSEQERRSLGAADLVKLVFVLDEAPASGPNAERMWVEVLGAAEGVYQGRLTNQPTVIPDLDDGALLEFDHRHVAGIALRRHEVAFAVDQHAVVTRRALARAVPPGWVVHDEPVDGIDSGWTVCAGDEPADHFSGDPETTTQAVTLGELAQRYPALVEVFQAGAGEWVYRPDHRRYVRVKNPAGAPTDPHDQTAHDQAAPDPDPDPEAHGPGSDQPETGDPTTRVPATPAPADPPPAAREPG
jgi:hypothetical protein